MTPREPQNLAERTERAQAVATALGYETIGARLRRHRQNQALSVRDLAERAVVNKNSILRLEKGLGSHPATLVRVCEALSIHVDSLALGAEAPDGLAAVARAGAPVWHDLDAVAAGPIDPDRSPGAIPIELLTSRLPNGRVVPTIIRVTRATTPASHHGEEFVYALEGLVRIVVAERTFELGPGDSICFWSGERHRYEPVGETATILSVRVDY